MIDRRIGDALAQLVLGAANFGGAGQERQHRAGLAADRSQDRVDDLPSSIGARASRPR